MKKIPLVLFMVIVFGSLSAQETVILQPGAEGKDAFVHSYEPDVNKGDAGDLNVMSWTFYGGNPGSLRTFIEFDLEFINPDSEIIDAKLSLFYYVSSSNPGLTNYGDNEAYIRRVITPWDEHTITWNNQPQMTEEHRVFLPASTSPSQDYLDIDVTQLIRDMLADPENSHGFGIRLITEDYYRALCFASGDNTDQNIRPKLVIVYRECDPPNVIFNYSRSDRTVQFESVCPSAQAWSWDFGDGYSASLENPVHAYGEKGKYYVCLTVEDTCGTSTWCDTVMVCDMPAAGFTYEWENQSIQFNNTSSLGESYWWDFGDLYFSAQASPSHQYTTSGTYMVSLVTRNVCGSDTAYSTVIVEYSGVDESGKGPVLIYPNPAGDYLYIAAGISSKISADIVNLQGITVLKQELEPDGGVVAIRVGGITPGIYILKLVSRDISWIQRIAIQ